MRCCELAISPDRGRGNYLLKKSPTTSDVVHWEESDNGLWFSVIKLANFACILAFTKFCSKVTFNVHVQVPACFPSSLSLSLIIGEVHIVNVRRTHIYTYRSVPAIFLLPRLAWTINSAFIIAVNEPPL